MKLSEIERNVLWLFAVGFTGEEIAEQMNCSASRIRERTGEIKEKLGALTLAHAVAIGVSAGIIGLGRGSGTNRKAA